MAGDAPTKQAGKREFAWLIVSLGLCFESLLFLSFGFERYLHTACDLRLRWVEQQYVLRGKNPLVIFERHQADQRRQILTRRPPSGIDPDLGPTAGGYPPWAYLTSQLFVLPSFALTRQLGLGLNMFCLGFLVWWAVRQAPRGDRSSRLLLMASVLACQSIAQTLELGQMGVIILAAIVAAQILAEAQLFIVAGLALALALTKPTLSGPFVLALLVKAQWKPVLVALGYLIIASLAIWPMTDTDPLTMLSMMTHSNENYSLSGYSAINPLCALGLRLGPATLLAAVGTLLATSLLLARFRKSSLTHHFIIAAVAARFWSYHQSYDNLMLLPLLVALGAAATASPNRILTITFLVVGLSLWIPTEKGVVGSFQYAQMLGWLAGLTIWLLAHARKLVGQAVPPFVVGATKGGTNGIVG